MLRRMVFRQHVVAASFSGRQEERLCWRQLVGLTLALSATALTISHAEEEHHPLPMFRRAEVESQNAEGKRVLVTFRDGVYDITQFIANHPGGSHQIMIAEGKDLNPFWNLPAFRQHLRSPLVMELLEELRIGNLHSDDIVLDDPFDPKDTTSTFTSDKIYNCIVIGSGVSGLQCAKTLTKDNGISTNDVLVLEAQDYIGGRVRQMTDFIRGVKIDIGAEFLHGGNTELTKFAEAQKEPLENIFCWAHGDGGPLPEPVGKGYGLYYIGDKNGPRKRLLRFDAKDKDFVQANEALWELCELNPADYSDSDSLYDYLVSKGLSEEMLMMANGGFANTLNTNMKELSLKRCIQWERLWHETEGEDDHDFGFVNSYSCLIDYLKKDLQIEVNSAVTDIAYSPSSEDNPFSELVQVKTVTGKASWFCLVTILASIPTTIPIPYHTKPY